MKHKEIWTEIAEAFLTLESEETKRQETLTSCGLCLALKMLTVYNDKIYSIVFSICQLKPRCQRSGFWFPIRGDPKHRREYDLIRGDMATLFACMTEEEFDQLITKGESNGDSTR